MQIEVRRAERADAPTLLRLIAALADYEKLNPPDPAAQERLLRHGWPEDGTSPRFSAWLAAVQESSEAEPQAVAYAITFPTYSSFLAQPTFYIEDIFVLPDFRRFGVGSALMRALVREAWETDCGRMEWVVLDWNTLAQQFYLRLGAEEMAQWQLYRLRRDQMPPLLTPPPPERLQIKAA